MKNLEARAFWSITQGHIPHPHHYPQLRTMAGRGEVILTQVRDTILSAQPTKRGQEAYDRYTRRQSKRERQSAEQVARHQGYLASAVF